MLKNVYVIAAMSMTAFGQAGFASTVDRDAGTAVFAQPLNTGGGTLNDGRSRGARPNVLPAFVETLQTANRPNSETTNDRDGNSNTVVVAPRASARIVQLLTDGRDGNVTPGNLPRGAFFAQSAPSPFFSQSALHGRDDGDTPQAVVSPVPIPAAGLLMIAGLGMLFGFGRWRRA